MQENARKRVVDALMRMHCGQGYSNKVVDSFLSAGEWKPEDSAFFSKVVYGVEERLLTLDYFVGAFCKTPMMKLHPLVLNILREGMYQILFMDKVPDSAAVNEAVNLCKQMQPKASGMVNAVLRNLIREKESYIPKYPNVEDLLLHMVHLPAGEEKDSILFSCPVWLIRLWKKAYGEETTKQLLLQLNETPPATIRINTFVSSLEEWKRFAEEQEISFETYDEIPNAVTVSREDERKLRLFGETKWYYQDLASQICVKALGALPGERVADVCAAPGGKSLTAAQHMQNNGTVISSDIYPQKCDALQKRAKELGCSILQTVPRDASKPVPKEWTETFDRVICDAPCSGLGVIRRRPEIRYRDLDETLPDLQLAILEEAAKLVKPGGVLQYSTCSLCPAENQEVVKRFQEKHPEFSPRVLPLNTIFSQSQTEPAADITLFPHLHKTDGFYIASFTKG